MSPEPAIPPPRLSDLPEDELIFVRARELDDIALFEAMVDSGLQDERGKATGSQDGSAISRPVIVNAPATTSNVLEHRVLSGDHAARLRACRVRPNDDRAVFVATDDDGLSWSQDVADSLGTCSQAGKLEPDLLGHLSRVLVHRQSRLDLHHNSRVRRETLIDFFDDLAGARGDFLVYDDGFRSRTFSYRRSRRAARGFAARLHAAGIRKGDKVVFFSRTGPNGLSRSGAACSPGIIVVPIDYRASTDFLARVSRIVSAKLMLVGQEVPPLADDASAGLRSGGCTRSSWQDGAPPTVTIGAR